MENDYELHFQNGILPVVIVCHCQGISERTIRKTVREGASSVRQVARSCGAARMCGGCRPAVRKLVEEETAADGGAPITVPGAVAAS